LSREREEASDHKRVRKVLEKKDERQGNENQRETDNIHDKRSIEKKGR